MLRDQTNDDQRRWHPKENQGKNAKLGTVTRFKYLVRVVSGDRSKPEGLSMIAQATAALTKLKLVWLCAC